MRFNERLAARCDQRGHLCIGLDPDLMRIRALCDPMGWRPGIADYCRFVIGATRDVASAFKLNSAFFEMHGAEGIKELEATIRECRSPSDSPIVILDAKRGDIGNSSRAYASAAFDALDADAVTVAPYMGTDSVRPFLGRDERGAFVLCRTSNPGARDFQDLGGGEPLYTSVARQAHTHWNASDNCGLVVGATYPDEVARVVATAPSASFLVPGIGAQGGSLSLTVAALEGSRAYVINSSRDIMYPDGPFKTRDDLAQAIRDRASQLVADIDSCKPGNS